MMFELFWAAYGGIAASIHDLYDYTIPNLLCIYLGLLGLVYHQFSWASIIGILLGLIVGGIVFYTKAWGGGDAKLLAGLGGVYGFGTPFALFLLSLVFVGVPYFVLFKRVLHFEKLAFAPVFAISSVIILLLF